MYNFIRGFRNFGIYLLPACLIATAGVLLMGLLYYPMPSTRATVESQALADTDDWRKHAEDMLAILLADALRQIQEEEEGHARTLRYQYEYALPSGERPAPPGSGTPCTDSDGKAGRPALIRL